MSTPVYAIQKISWSLEEYRALADRYADAVEQLQIAVQNEGFAAVISAFLTFDEVAKQTAFLNTGLRNAIESVQQKDSAS